MPVYIKDFITHFYNAGNKKHLPATMNTQVLIKKDSAQKGKDLNAEARYSNSKIILVQPFKSIGIMSWVGRQSFALNGVLGKLWDVRDGYIVNSEY